MEFNARVHCESVRVAHSKTFTDCALRRASPVPQINTIARGTLDCLSVRSNLALICYLVNYFMLEQANEYLDIVYNVCLGETA